MDYYRIIILVLYLQLMQGAQKDRMCFKYAKNYFQEKNPQLSNNQKVLSGYVKIHKINIAGKKKQKGLF